MEHNISIMLWRLCLNVCLISFLCMGKISSGFETNLIIAKDNGLYLYNSSRDASLTRQGIPFSVDFVKLSNETYRLFWSDLQTRSIYSGLLHNYKLTDISPIIISRGGTIEGISVDWLGQFIYWVNSDFGLIEVATIDGKFYSPLISNLINPRSLGVDPVAGWLFWSDWNEASPHIGRSTLSGQNIKTIVKIDNSIGGWINAITLDYASEKIYWIDAKSGHINEATYDGRNQRLVYISKHVAFPMGLAVYDNKVIWSDNGISSLLQVNITNAEGKPNVLYESFSKLYGITVLKEPHVIGIQNPCAKNNGGCSHICFANDALAECHCPYGSLLGPNNKTCQGLKNALIVLYQDLEKEDSLIYIQDIKNPSWPVKPSTFLHESSAAISFEYNSTDGTVILLDKRKNAVVKENALGIQNILLETFDGTKSFALEKHSRDIYLGVGETSPQISHCSVEMNVYSCTPLVRSDVGEPLDLFLYYEKRLLIWLNKLSTTVKIESVSLSNLTQRRVIAEGKGLCCLTINLQRQEILWFNEIDGHVYWKSLNDDAISSWTLPVKLSVIAMVTIDNILMIASPNTIMSVNMVDKVWSSFNIKRKGYIIDVKAVSFFSDLQNASTLILSPEEDKMNGSSEESLSMTDSVTWSSQGEYFTGNHTANDSIPTPQEYCTRSCQNYGKCIKYTSGEVCKCKEGFIGSLCEKNICENYCYNGECTVRRKKISCICSVGWRGRLCNQKIINSSKQVMEGIEVNVTKKNPIEWRIIERNISEIFGLKVSNILVDFLIIGQFIIIILLIFCLFSRICKNNSGSLSETDCSEPLHKEYCTNTEECSCKNSVKHHIRFTSYKKKLKEWLVRINSARVKSTFPCWISDSDELLQKEHRTPNETTV